jgi:Fe-S cluster biogenesis protein NfuA
MTDGLYTVARDAGLMDPNCIGIFVEQEIKITAEFNQDNADVCKFTVDRPVYAGKLVARGEEQASGIPLAEKLFEIEDITGVTIYGTVVLVTKLPGKDWREVGARVGAVIREHVKTGLAPTLEQYETSKTDPDLIRNKVRDLLEMQINPGVAGHGGWVELIDVKDNNVYLRMSGGCQGCGMADVTLKQGIETLIREEVPEVWEVFDTTDHAAGTNPYYEPAK